MIDLKSVLKSKKSTHIRGKSTIDFFVDRLFHHFTSKLIIIFVLILSIKRLFVAPINCWVPKELSRYERFINRYCWIKGTSYVNQIYEDSSTLSLKSSHVKMLQYYQWVSLFLLFQALLFYMPHVVWSFVSERILEYDLANMASAMKKLGNFKADRENILKYLKANLVLNRVSYNSSKIRSLKALVDKGVYFEEDTKRRSNYWLTLVYISLKLSYVLVVVFQLLIMNYFLNSDESLFLPSYGTTLVNKMLIGEADCANQTDSVVFPKLAICEVLIREKDSTTNGQHFHSFSCVMSLNLFNERIFGILWFWICLVLLPVCFIDLCVWLLRFLFFQAEWNLDFVKNRLLVANTVKNSRLVRIFARCYLNNDAVFVMRLLENNSGILETSDLLESLWIEFKSI
jgi:hypothetical protein